MAEVIKYNYKQFSIKVHFAKSTRRTNAEESYLGKVYDLVSSLVFISNSHNKICQNDSQEIDKTPIWLSIDETKGALR